MIRQPRPWHIAREIGDQLVEQAVVTDRVTADHSEPQAGAVGDRGGPVAPKW